MGQSWLEPITEDLSRNQGDPVAVFTSRGWTYRASGEEAHVYTSPDGRHVARFSANIVTSFAGAELARHNQDNPYFPEITHHQVAYYDSSRRDPLHVLVTPVLSTANTPELDTQAFHIANMVGAGQAPVPEAIKEKLLNDPHFQSAFRQTMAMADELNKTFADILPRIDANEDNFLFRISPDGSAQPVFADSFRSTQSINRRDDIASNHLRGKAGMPLLDHELGEGPLRSLVPADRERIVTWDVLDYDHFASAVRQQAALVRHPLPDSPFSALDRTFTRASDPASPTCKQEAVNPAPASAPSSKPQFPR